MSARAVPRPNGDVDPRLNITRSWMAPRCTTICRHLTRKQRTHSEDDHPPPFDDGRSDPSEGSSSDDEPRFPPRREGRNRGAAVPPLDVRLAQAVKALKDDLRRETAGRYRTESFTPLDFVQAETLARYLLSTLLTIRHTDRGARRLDLSDMRELGAKCVSRNADVNAAVHSFCANGAATC